MKYRNLFSGENKKNISLCRLLKILPKVLSIYSLRFLQAYFLRSFPNMALERNHV